MDSDPPSSPLAIKPDYDAADESGDSDYVDVRSAIASELENDGDEIITKADAERPPDDAGSPKRQAEEPASGHQPPKRRKRAFNHHYLNLLNADIEDAANHLLLETKRSGKRRLRRSQIGLTVWSTLEKELFFEAVSRLGRDNLPGIAERVRSKNEIEIRQYLRIFEDVLAERDRNPQRVRWEDVLEMADFPAATELSQECCDALEEEADDLSRRIDRYEQKLEKKKWGDELWCIDPKLAKRLEKVDEPTGTPQPAFASLFRLPTWLSLSDKIFMNSADTEANWHWIDHEPPTLQATAMEDFHNLVVAVTRKLVASSLFVAQSRVKAKFAVKPQTKLLVKPQDVQAAAASIGLASDRDRHWATCARRLNLLVYEDPPLDGEDEAEQHERPDAEEETAAPQPFSHDQVEDMLLQQDAEETSQPEKPRSRIMHLIDFELSDPDPTTSGSDSESEDMDGDYRPLKDENDEGTDSAGKRQPTEEDLEVREEANEILMYSARDIPETLRARDALETRIRREMGQERYADYVDAVASHDGESEMWHVLQRSPPTPLARPEPVEKTTKSIMGLNELHNYGTRWRETLRYVSEWEHEGVKDKAR